MTPTKLRRAVLALVVIGAGCNYDIQNPNTPGVIGENPSVSQVGAAARGLLLATRADVADWALDGAIWGREAYRIDAADPRFVQEMMQGPLDAGSRAFGGDHWLEEYAAIRSANDLLAVIVPWLQLNSLGLTILLHPNTDDPRADHLYYALWVNRSQPVNAYGMKKPGAGEPAVEQIYPNTKPTLKAEI